MTLVSTIIALARSLQLSTVAGSNLRLTSMRALIVTLLCIAAASACSRIRRPEPAAAAAQPVEANPFDGDSTSFVVSGPQFTPGETAIVKVCVSPDGVITSAGVIASSGDKRFDDFALVWARQVKLATATAIAMNTKDVCGAVRVEIRGAPLPSLGGRDNALG